jgi:hypothetical protein
MEAQLAKTTLAQAVREMKAAQKSEWLTQESLLFRQFCNQACNSNHYKKSKERR